MADRILAGTGCGLSRNVGTHDEPIWEQVVPTERRPAMCDEERALLAGIFAQPADDTARLVYADWLQEHGEPERAEFIRAQVELAKIDLPKCEQPVEKPPPDEPWWARMSPPTMVACKRCDACRYRARNERTARSHRARSDELLAAHADDWVPRVNAIWDWHRGFVRAIDGITTADWFEHADAILALHPLRAATLTTAWTAGEFRRRDGSNCSVRSAADFRAFLEGEWDGITFAIPPRHYFMCSYLAPAFNPAALQEAIGRINERPTMGFARLTVQLLDIETAVWDVGGVQVHARFASPPMVTVPGVPTAVFYGTADFDQVFADAGCVEFARSPIHLEGSGA